MLDPKLQAAITEVRTAGLNIMMSMKEAGKPISFVEDCAVPLEHLADYTARLTEVFERNGTRGTWYAHAAVGCLHVRPVLNLRLDKDVRAMRAIAEEAFAMVREYKGSHSGEHGDGIVRSEFHEKMFGAELVHAFEEVKDRFDPQNLFNPGKIVRAPKFDDRTNFRYGPDYRAEDLKTALDWSAYSGAGGGFQGAVEMCNNNGACRALAGGVMCPSYRVTRDERDVTRGRANSLRLAITGQLGPDALTSDEMAETLKLCVSCKACRRECPTGVDMARMKIEVSAGARGEIRPYAARSAGRLSAALRALRGAAALAPQFARCRSRRGEIVRGGGGVQRAAELAEVARRLFSRRDILLPPPLAGEGGEGAGSLGLRDAGPLLDRFAIRPPPQAGEAKSCLFADTFNRYFERENIDAALAVLTAAGYRVHFAAPTEGERPLCCGRTFLSVGKVDEARREAERTLAALAPFAAKGIPVIGLEPSCLFSFRDEIPSLVKSEAARQVAGNALLVRGIFGARGCNRQARPQTRADEEAGAAARPLPSKIFRHDERGRGDAEAHSRS